jgi:hypothetical protein
MHEQSHRSLKGISLAVLLFLVTGCSPPEPTSAPPPTSPTPASPTAESPSPTVPATANPSRDPLEYLYNNLDELDVCQGDIDLEASRQGSEVYRVDEQTDLVQLMCFLAAYQGSYEYYLYRETASGVEVEPLTLTVFEPTESGQMKPTQTRFVGGLPDYNPERQLLTVFTKFRGLGDCGAFAQYRFENDEFELLEYRVKQECDGNYVEPEQYPQVYPES